MKRVYVTNECCTCRHAVFASDEINGERPIKNGDYDRWPYGIRETRRIAKFKSTIAVIKNAVAGSDIYWSKTARAVLDLLGID